MFLRDGYLGANMDELTALSGVSKQTVYAHFGSKEALFVELVGSHDRGGRRQRAHRDLPDPTPGRPAGRSLDGLGRTASWRR